MSDITEKISDVVTTVTDIAREYGEVARLQALIKAEEAKKQEYYYRLGKKYYELYKDAPASDLSEYMAKLIAADEKIADYRADMKAASSKEARDAAEETDGEAADVSAGEPVEEPAESPVAEDETTAEEDNSDDEY